MATFIPLTTLLIVLLNSSIPIIYKIAFVFAWSLYCIYVCLSTVVDIVKKVKELIKSIDNKTREDTNSRNYLLQGLCAPF